MGGGGRRARGAGVGWGERSERRGGAERSEAPAGRPRK